MTAAIKFQEMMPKDEVPELTEGREGFIHLMEFNGSIEKTTLHYIVRDHDRAKFEAKKELVQQAFEALQKEYGEDAVQLEMNDQYYNMAEKIEPVKFIVDLAEEAMLNLGITPIKKAIRGGTDGSQLSFMGLPTPNIFAGGENMHGKYEYVSAETMEKATEVILEIVKLYEQRG